MILVFIIQFFVIWKILKWHNLKNINESPIHFCRIWYNNFTIVLMKVKRLESDILSINLFKYKNIL